MKSTVTKLVQIAIIGVLIAFLLSSCRTINYTSYWLSYDLSCENCGSSSDSVLEIFFPNQINNKNNLHIQIKNVTDEVILLDQRFFSASFNGYLILNPISDRDPNEQHSFTTASSYYESGVGQSNLNNLTFSFSSQYLKEITSGNAKSHTRTINPQPIISLPPNSILNYPIYDYYRFRFNVLDKKSVYNFDERLYEYSDESALLSQIKELEGVDFKISIVYKRLNDEYWNSISTIVSAKNMQIEKKKPNGKHLKTKSRKN